MPAKKLSTCDALKSVYEGLIKKTEELIVLGFLYFVWIKSGSYAVLLLLLVILFFQFWFIAEIIAKNGKEKNLAVRIVIVSGSITFTGLMLVWFAKAIQVIAKYS